jgi:hypothetical protein
MKVSDVSPQGPPGSQAHEPRSWPDERLPVELNLSTTGAFPEIPGFTLIWRDILSHPCGIQQRPVSQADPILAFGPILYTSVKYQASGLRSSSPRAGRIALYHTSLHTP